MGHMILPMAQINASTKVPYWASSCILFIDSILGFAMPSLVPLIRPMTETKTRLFKYIENFT